MTQVFLRKKTYYTVYGYHFPLKDITNKVYTYQEFNDLKAFFQDVETIWAKKQDEEAARLGGDKGSCVLGAGFCIWVRYPRKRNATLTYVVDPQAKGRYQGSIMWEASIEEITKILDDRGIDHVYMWGRLD